MGCWKSSNTFGIDYHIMKTPESNHNYYPGDPVTSSSAAKGELMLSAIVAANHNSIFNSIWYQGIPPLESRIIQKLNLGKNVLAKGVSVSGVLIVATVFESLVVNQDVKAPQRCYHSTHMEDSILNYTKSHRGIYEDYKIAAYQWSRMDKIFPRKENLKTVFYHIWAVKS